MASATELQLGLVIEQAKRAVRSAVADLRNRVLLRWEQAIGAGVPVAAARGLVVAELAAIQVERWRPLYSALDSTYNAAVAGGWTEGVVARAVAAGGLDARAEWQTVSSKPCPDCEGRHGDVRPVAEWRRVGMPRTRWPGGNAPVCSLDLIRCKCLLVPVGAGAGRILTRVPDEARPGRTLPGA